MLIAREMGVPSEEDSGDRWSADHLFLDQDAVPTIVEVKRSTDTRSRREVVAQMLDYAANGILYWPLERLRSTFEANCEARGQEPETTLLESLGLELDPEEFWQRAATNLQAGKVRLIFVADRILPELRRIVEFLNEQMNPAEVLAIEIKQHVAEDFKAFVPRVIGQTAQAERTKSAGAGASSNRKWDEETFFQALELNPGTDEADIVRKILEWSRDGKLPRIEWNAHRQYGLFWPCMDHKGVFYWPIGVRTDGKIEVIFQWLKDRQPFVNEAKREELLERLNEISGVDIPLRLHGRPSFPLSELEDDAAFKQLLEVLDWFVEEVKAT